MLFPLLSDITKPWRDANNGSGSISGIVTTADATIPDWGLLVPLTLQLNGSGLLLAGMNVMVAGMGIAGIPVLCSVNTVPDSTSCTVFPNNIPDSGPAGQVIPAGSGVYLAGFP